MRSIAKQLAVSGIWKETVFVQQFLATRKQAFTVCAGGGVWNQYQLGGGDMEEQDQGPVSQP